MCLDVQEARHSDTRFNERKILQSLLLKKNIKSIADSTYSPSRFDLLNCETTENIKNNFLFFVYNIIDYTWTRQKIN